MKKYIFGLAVLLAATSFTTTAEAQINIASEAFPVIIAPHAQSVSYRERTLCFDVASNVEFTISCDASWATVRKADDGSIYVHVTENPDITVRTANITFANAANSLSETLVITQGKNESIKDVVLPEDIYIKPSSASTNTYQGGAGIELSYDRNTSTIYHSLWSATISESNPANLIYNFNNVDVIDYIRYVPRQDGNSNGYFTKVAVYTKCQGESDYTLYQNYSWSGSSATKTVTFPDGLKNPVSVKFVVTEGSNGFASCAEMEFWKRNPEENNLFDIFADDVYSELKPGTTQDDIDDIDDSFVHNLAQQLFDGTYKKDYRVAEYPCILSPNTQSDLWSAPGKYYDQLAGVTGINISKGTHGIVVSGLPEGESVPLKVVAWFVGKYGTNFDGGNPYTTTFNLQNGLNRIEYTYDYDGLAYICYYDDVNPKLRDNIKVHFVNGQINGYLHHGLTNAEMHELCKNAPSMHMDCVSNKVHAVWESQGFYNFCKATDGSIGYIQYMNVLDSLLTWEHRSLGFEKYNSLPDNRTFAYVNYTYYMFQGGLGVSFIHSQQQRVLNCNTLINNDNDAIWGLSHEWGHQHQMTPYFCWAGMSEVTNNVQSYYNIMKMGYRVSDKIDCWPDARKHFITGNDSKVSQYSNIRSRAYQNRTAQSYSSKMLALCTAMADSAITTYNEDPTRAVYISDVSVGETLCPFIMLYNYFTTHGFPDFAPDWYESLRQNNNEAGSQVEKTSTEPDKYELIAAAQNGSSTHYQLLKQKYPNCTWIKDNCITASSTYTLNSAPFVMNWCRKTSRLVGYNLFPYFEKWGFLRQVACYIGDYGNKWYVCTKEMYDEFKDDMDALVESGELKAMPDGMVEEISNSPEWFQDTPNIPNK